MKHKKLIPIMLSLLLVSALIPAAAAIEKPLTQAESELTAEGDLPAGCAESKLADLAADAVLEASGSQLAILPASAVTGTLEQGAVYNSDLERVIPEDLPLVTATLSPAQLRDTLETGVSKLTRDSGDYIDVEASSWDGFPQLAGGDSFKWEYDVSAPVGERVQYIQLNGEELDLTDTETQLTITSVASMFDGSLGYEVIDAQSTNLTLRQAVHDYCHARDTISKPSTRSSAIGTSNYTIKDKFPVPLIVGICIVFALISAVPKWKEQELFTFKSRKNK